MLLLLLDATIFLKATSTWSLRAHFTLCYEVLTCDCGFCLFLALPLFWFPLCSLHTVQQVLDHINLKLLLDSYVVRDVTFITLSMPHMSALHKVSAQCVLVELS